MFLDTFALIGMFVTFSFLYILFIRTIVWLMNRCSHKWEFYDCSNTRVELRCQKCGRVKHINCTVNDSEWLIEYKGGKYANT